MPFMTLEMTDKQTGYAVDTVDGTFYVPSDVCGGINLEEEDAIKILLPYTGVFRREHVESVTEVRGYFARMSAPGYLDCTSWEFDRNKRRLVKTMHELHGDPGTGRLEDLFQYSPSKEDA